MFARTQCAEPQRRVHRRGGAARAGAGLHVYSRTRLCAVKYSPITGLLGREGVSVQ